ncbi:MAG: AAA family ATPase [Meiothermus sp.]|nr:AAA family ATPase [Meiothermus sp.]
MSKLELPPEPPIVSFVVDGLIPRGHASLLYAPAGVGKTRLLAYLAVQLTRPNGGMFGHYKTAHGWVLILDADDPSGTGFAQWVNRFLKGCRDAQRSLLDHRAVSGGLLPHDIDKLAVELEQNPPTLIILDSFAAAFIGVDSIKAHKVQEPLTKLVELAVNIGAGIVITDHVGKLAPKQTVAEKGAMGTAQKMAAPRAAFALDKLPADECNERDVLRLVCTKQSYAPVPPPMGLEVVLEGDIARITPFDLPNSERADERAARVGTELLSTVGSKGIARGDLLKAMEAKAGVGSRTAANALKLIESRLGNRLKIERLGGRGNPLLYRLE